MNGRIEREIIQGDVLQRKRSGDSYLVPGAPCTVIDPYRCPACEAVMLESHYWGMHLRCPTKGCGIRAFVSFMRSPVTTTIWQEPVKPSWWRRVFGRGVTQ